MTTRRRRRRQHDGHDRWPTRRTASVAAPAAGSARRTATPTRRPEHGACNPTPRWARPSAPPCAARWKSSACRSATSRCGPKRALPRQVDPYSQEINLIGTWRGKQRYGTVTLFPDGRVFAEYQVLLPHPVREDSYVESVQIWGTTGEVARRSGHCRIREIADDRFCRA